MTIGYDFVNTGFAGRNWPGWMQYFSFAMDLTFNKLEVRGGQTIAYSDNEGHSYPYTLPNDARMKGYEVAWTFLFMAHYGFLRDDVAPSGRINPYIGVGLPYVDRASFYGQVGVW